jgi:uncharacterized cupin superfamily protein
MTSETSLLVAPEAGEQIWDGPIGTVVKVASATTNGQLSICEMPVAPGFMVPPHTHHATDEWTYVLEGTIGARIGDQELSAGPGSWILKPRGRMHTFWNAGPATARIIELITPGQFEHFFRDSVKLVAAGELSDERLAALAAEHQTEVSMDWVEELAQRYGLQVTI